MSEIENELLTFFPEGVEHQPIVLIDEVARRKNVDVALVREAIWRLLAERMLELSTQRKLRAGPQIERGGSVERKR